MNEASGRDQQPAARRSVQRSRLERRTYRRALRRRRARKRLWLTTTPALVLVVAVAIFLALVGRSQPEVSVPSTIPFEAPKDGLVLIVDGQAVLAAVVLHATDQGGVALAVPGLSLVRLPARGFLTIADAHLAGEDEQLGPALGEALGTGIAGVVSANWTDLNTVVAASKTRSLPSLTDELTAGDLTRTAEAVLAALVQEESREALLGGNPPLLGGQVEEFRKALANFRFSASDKWTSAAVEGRRVRSEDGVYVEADWDAAGALLAGGATRGQAAVQVRNGCGVLGVVEQAGEFLASAGFKVLPPANAEGFPNVELSSVRASPDVLAKAALVSDLLDIVNLAADDSLASGEVIVVLGKDFVPPVAMVTGTLD